MDLQKTNVPRAKFFIIIIVFIKQDRIFPESTFSPVFLFYSLWSHPCFLFLSAILSRTPVYHRDSDI